MGHPTIENQTAMAMEPVFVGDGHGRTLCVTVVKAGFAIDTGKALMALDESIPVNLAGEYWGDPDASSYKYEPECAFTKTATDVILIGHAHAPNAPVPALEVGLRVGPVKKVVRVTGDRYLTRRGGAVSVSNPKPFDRMPLVYERAFGGWDRSHPDPNKHTFEPRNPVGTGYRATGSDSVEPILLPNIEDRERPWRGYGDRPPPAGFGFIGPNWEPRARYAGTYDAEWDKTRKPLLPKDFDRRYFNAASPGLVAPGYLRGDEPVAIVNASARGRLDFRLPGVPAPRCAVELRDGRREVLQTHLDTVIINTDEDCVFLLWRQFIPVPDGPEDVLGIDVGTNEPATVGATG